MKRSFALVSVAAFALPVFAMTLEEGFKAPPDSAKPHTWYHMMNGNVTKEGITCDFEALAKAGIGGVQMFDAGCDIPAGPVKFNSDEWFDFFRHAQKEAKRLGLEICIPNCSGWSSSGGPWNMPSNGMKRVVFTETAAKGPSKFSKVLPREKNDNGFYEDIAVLAFPTPPADTEPVPKVETKLDGKVVTLSSPGPFRCSGVSFRLSFPWTWTSAATVHVEVSKDGKTFEALEDFRVQLAFGGTLDHSMRYHPFPECVEARAVRLSFTSWTPVKVEEARPETKLRISGVKGKTFEMRSDTTRDKSKPEPGQVVGKDSVVDISRFMSPDGKLEWDVPEGDWTIFRIGHICNGRCNHPASKFGKGLEVDKLSASAMDYHFSQYVSRLCRDLGISDKTDNSTGFNNILVDSYEVGSQNWTQGLDKEFEKRAGYPIKQYLPVFGGHVVGSVDESERFLEDFRRVVADLFAENYAGRLTQLCHKHGLMCSIEPYGNSPSDDLQYGQDIDIPMAEFWSKAGNGNHGAGDIGNSRHAAHLAHVWGRRYAATESFTADPGSGGRWRTTPFAIKSLGDRAFSAGINRIIYHRFTHQPWPGNKYLPGMTMGRWGMHLDRTQTWWELSPDWFAYQARCQWMLQEGVFVADVLYWSGEEVPNGNEKKVSLPGGYDFDICATKAVEMLTVKNGKLVVPGGVEYSLLILPETDTMSERMVKRIGELLDQGAKICALSRPVRAPGLRGYPEADARLRELVAKVWSRGVMECSPSEALSQIGAKPDAYVQDGSWIHRRSADADWYFVARDNETPVSFEASFLQAGRAPEIWDAETGKTRPAEVWREENGRTFVQLDFGPSGSAFVVFRKPVAEAHAVKVTAEVSKNPEPTDGNRHALEIVKAEYGVPLSRLRPSCFDISQFVEPGKEVAIGNSLAGDPAGQVVKTAEIVYSLDGRRVVDKVGEGAKYTLPKKAKLESAWYGVIDPEWEPPKESTLIDLTEKVRAQVKDGTLSVVVNNGFAGRDPTPNVRKSTTLTYVYDGRESSIAVGEGERISLPAHAEAPQPPPTWEWLGPDVLAWEPVELELALSDGKTRHLSAKPRAPIAVKGPWNVSFPSGWGAPASVVFTDLTPWDMHKDDGIKYFSGTATYARKVEMPAFSKGTHVMLDLGCVMNFAVVKVNGRRFPVLWKPPFRLDVTDALREGDTSFDLEVEVTNLWANRLIGDDRQYPDDCEWNGRSHAGKKEIAIKDLPQWVREGKPSPTGRHTFTTWKHWSKEDQLLPSGLIGPVVLRFGEMAK